MRRILIAAMMATLLLPTAAQAENWRLAGSTEEWPAVLSFINTDSVSKSGDHSHFALLIYQEGETPEQDERWAQTWSADCKSTQYIVENSQHFVGETLADQSDIAEAAVMPVPNGIDLSIVEAAFGNRDYFSDTVADPADYANTLFNTLADEEAAAK